jgi:hypothetical protein
MTGRWRDLEGGAILNAAQQANGASKKCAHRFSAECDLSATTAAAG